MKSKLAILAALAAVTVSANAQSNVQISEIMYTGLFGEFVEIVNDGDTAQDMTGWSFSDNARTIGDTSLSQIGTLSPGEVAIITEVSDAIFNLAWFTEPGTDAGRGVMPVENIVENNSTNLGRSDEVNIYPAGATNPVTGFQDRVTYNDQGSGAVDGPRSEDVSAIVDDLSDPFSGFVLSQGGTVDNSWKAGDPSAPGPVGSPGVFPNF